MKRYVLFQLTSSLRYEFMIIGGVIILIFSLPLLSIVALAQGNNISSDKQMYNGPGDVDDTYSYGNCTWWVFKLRKESGHPVPTSWGNADTWAYRAVIDGYIVDHTPSLGSIMQTGEGIFGHVAYVSEINLMNGDWTISEMNVLGWDVVDSKTLPYLASNNYNFIH